MNRKDLNKIVKDALVSENFHDSLDDDAIDRFSTYMWEVYTGFYNVEPERVEFDSHFMSLVFYGAGTEDEYEFDVAEYSDYLEE